MIVMATRHGDRLARQERAASTLLADVTKQQVVYTPKKSLALVDGLIIKGNEIQSCFELKCRDMTVEKLRSYGNTWMLNVAKVKRCASVSKALCVPLYGALYLVPDETLYWIQITDSKGNIICEHTKETRRGKETSISNRWIDEEVYLIPVE